jgi:hypothetical protein
MQTDAKHAKYANELIACANRRNVANIDNSANKINSTNRCKQER